MLFNIIHTYRYHAIAEACPEIFHQEQIPFSGGQKYFHQCQNLQFLRLPPMRPMKSFSSGVETYYFEFYLGNIQRCIPPQICSSGAYAPYAPRLDTPTRDQFINLYSQKYNRLRGFFKLACFTIMQNLYSNLVIHPN